MDRSKYRKGSLDPVQYSNIIRTLQAIIGGVPPSEFDGLAQENTLLAIKTATELAVWEGIAGNSKVFTYYDAPDPINNPSGTTTNVKTIIYKTGITTVITQTFVWDISDRVISLTAS